MIYAQRTVKGRVVYDRRIHHFKPSRIASIAMALINRFPIDDQPDEYYWGWQSLAYVAANATKAIGWRWTKGQINQAVLDLRNDRNAGLILALRDFIRGARSALTVAGQWGGSIPYVGAVLGVGNTIIDNIVNEAALSMPAIVTDPKTGRDIIYW